jgi:hypothetical protein
MNRFEWNLRYPDATDVTGFQAPVAAGGLEDNVDGPQVVPGSYSVVLDYGGKRMRQNFETAMDPRLNVSQDDLAARLALDVKIHTTLDSLDKKINEAISVRDKLETRVKDKHLSEAQAGKAVSDLSDEIGNLVQLKIQSSEGSLLHETKLHSYLAYLAADVDLAYSKPTAAQEAVFDHLDQEAKAAEEKLDAVIAAANKLL